MKQNELISKFRLPAYISGKSFSDASKIISSKFDGRNDMISKTTKNELLKRLADAQEYLKASQESEQQSNQFMLGGSADNSEFFNNNSQINSNYQQQSQGSNAELRTVSENTTENTMEGIKGGVATAIPIAGAFKAVEGMGKQLGQSIGGNAGGDYAQGFLDPSSNFANKDNSVLQKFASGDPIFSAMLTKRNNDKKRLTAGNNNAANYSTMFQDKKDNMEGYAFGGEMENVNSEIDPNKKKFNTSYLGMIPGAMSLGQDAMTGKNVSTNTGSAMGMGAMKGAATGATAGPYGALVGAGVGAIVGLIGSKKAKKTENTNMYNNMTSINNMYKDQNMNAYGGELSDGLSIDPPVKKTTSKNLTQLSVGNSLTPLAKKNMFIQANQNKPKTKAYNDALNKYLSEETAVNSTVKPIVKIQSGVRSDKMGPGYYVYSKYPIQNIESDREFVSNSGYDALKGTVPYRDYMKSYDPNTRTYNNKLAHGGPYTTSDSLKPLIQPIDGMSPSWERNTLGQGDPNEDLGNLKNDLNYAQYMNQLPTGSVETGTSGKEGSNGLNKAGAYLKDNYANILRYAPAAMNAFQLAKLKKPGYVTTKKLTNEYTPQQVDEVRLRNEIDTQYNNSISSLSGATGGSNAATTAAILAATANRGRDVSDMMNKSQDYNRAEKEKAYTYKAATDTANIGQYNLEQDINDKNMGNYDTQKSKLLSQLGNDIGGIGKEQLFKQYPKLMGMRYDSNGKYFINDKTGEKVMVDELTSDKTNTKAMGGNLSSDVISHINSMYINRKKK